VGVGVGVGVVGLEAAFEEHPQRGHTHHSRMAWCLVAMLKVLQILAVVDGGIHSSTSRLFFGLYDTT
jgi:hypothetical protein